MCSKLNDMNWTYESTINRMGEETKILSNESNDIPLFEEYQKPLFIITKSDDPSSLFSIKLKLNGLELKKTICTNCCKYLDNCYCCGYTHIRKIVLSTTQTDFRVRFDEDKPTTYYCGVGSNTITFPNDFIDKMKNKDKMLIEFNITGHGKVYYEFNIEGLENLCKEKEIYNFKKPNIKIKKENSNSFYNWLYYGILFFICMIFLVCGILNKETATPPQSTTYPNEIHFDKMIEYPNWGRVSTAANLLNNIPTENVLINMINKSLSMCYHNGQVDRIYVYQTEKKEQIIVRVSFYRSDYNSNYNSSDDKLFYFNGNTFEFVKEYKN